MSKAEAIKAKLRRKFEQTPAVLPVALMRRLTRIGALSARGGLKVLVGKLPGVRGSESDLDAVERNVTSLAELKGVPMKVGQILGYMDTKLPDESRAAYSVLFNCSPSIPLAHAKAGISESLGRRAPAIMANMETRPVAAASIGQVYRTTLDGKHAIAVKVRHPEIERAIAHDFKPAAFGARIGGWLDQTTSREILVQEVEERLLSECDYGREARQQKKFAEWFGDHPTLLIPAVHSEFCGRRVLTSDFIDGVDLDEFLAGSPSQEERDRAGAALFDFYFGSLFRFALYNCDPHPGNYLFCEDGRVAIVDHGCTRSYPADFVAQFAALTRAVKADDRAAMNRALRDLDMLGLEYAYDADGSRAVLRWFFGPLLRDEVCTFEVQDAEVREVMSNTQLLRWRIPAEFVFLVRMRVGLAAVLVRLGARVNWSARLAGFLAACDQQLAKNRPFDDAEPRLDVVLVDAGERIIEVVRELRARFELSITEAKALVDDAPSVLQRGLEPEEGAVTLARFEALGCDVELRPGD